MKKIKKILVISGSRAEYYILKKIILKISQSFYTRVLIHAGHQQSFYGNSGNQVDKSLKKKIIKSKTNLGKSNSEKSIIKSMTIQMSVISRLIEKFKPDAILIAGDRTESLSAANVSLIYQIPIIHIHGGELTLGSIDEKIRHAISKISSIHFVIHNEYKKRLIQMGENKKFIKNFGSPSLEILKDKKILKPKEFMKKFKLESKKFILVSINSENSYTRTAEVIKNTISTLNKYKNYIKVITYPNPDINNLIIIKSIDKIKKNKDYKVYRFLGENYSQFLAHCKFMVGNSSSGIIEAPFFKKRFVNIGNRQKGRILCNSILNASYTKKDIAKKIKMAHLQKKIKFSNSFFKIGTSINIIKSLKKYNLEDFKYKKFIDLK